MVSPFSHTPHPRAAQAAQALMQEVRHYMQAHPMSELHRRGKMFGVLIASDGQTEHVLRAFSSMLDGEYVREGFVPPVYRIPRVVGCSREDSREKQNEIFSHFRFLNALGEEQSLPELFLTAPTLRSFDGEHFRIPSGAGECCAPKLLQEAYRQGMMPVEMAEFWMGASPQDELRTEGQFYPACSGRCRPILNHMLRGVDVAPAPLFLASHDLAQQTTILFEDDYLIVANKPAGLLTVPGKDADCFSLEQHLGARAAHRLDMDTSGIVVLCKKEELLPLMQKQFLRRDIHKRYVAVLEEAPKETAGLIRLPLRPDPLDRPRQVVDFEHGKEAITRWELAPKEAGFPANTVYLYPETGRTHQLRVHCAHPSGLHAPILGDRLYGKRDHSECFDRAKSSHQLECSRLMLHAAELTFTHPITSEPLHILSTPPFK